MLALAATPCFGQQTLLDDDFENNKNGWRLQQDSNFRVAIEDGVLRLEKFEKNFTSRGCLWYNKVIPGLNTLKDFSIKVYAKFVSGGDVADVIDLQWGANNRTEYGQMVGDLYQLTFLLRSKLRLEHFNRRWTTVADEELPNEWKADFDPKRLNKYEVEQKDSTLVFRVNDQEMLRESYKPIAGSSIGFQQCLKSAWEIDRIVIRQEVVNRTAAPDVVKTTRLVY